MTSHVTIFHTYVNQQLQGLRWLEACLSEGLTPFHLIPVCERSSCQVTRWMAPIAFVTSIIDSLHDQSLEEDPIILTLHNMNSLVDLVAGLAEGSSISNMWVWILTSSSRPMLDTSKDSLGYPWLKHVSTRDTGTVTLHGWRCWQSSLCTRP